jgi:hypothetical protein
MINRQSEISFGKSLDMMAYQIIIKVNPKYMISNYNHHKFKKRYSWKKPSFIDFPFINQYSLELFIIALTKSFTLQNDSVRIRSFFLVIFSK